MADQASPAVRFKQALERPELLQIPGGFSPLIARMLESLGFEAFFMAGSQTTAHVYALPDIGLIGMREMIEAARRITAVSGIPVFMDGDTGYGNVLNVHRTVRECAQAGVACISLEDQEAPKRSGTAAGRRCIPEEEALGKIRAAVAARDEIGSDMLICARTDLIGSEGGSYEAALERSIKFVEQAGADLVWINTVETREQMHEACERIPAPVIPHYGGGPPGPSTGEMEELGAAAMLFPGMIGNAGMQAMWEFLNDFKERGVEAQRDWGRRTAESRWGPVDYRRLLKPSPDEIQAIEADYLPQELQRDYEHTWGHGTQV